jgi:hypothetical protein
MSLLCDGGSKINIITENLKVQLGMSKPNPVPYNLMMDQIIAKPLGLIKYLKIFVHGIPCIIIFTIIDINVLDSNYSMLLKRPWVRDAKVSHDWGTNIVIIQGIGTIRTIHVTKKLGVQTKKPKVLMCYDFHFGISNEKEDVMFATKLSLFSIGNIAILTHIKFFPKSTCILNLNITKLVPKQPIELVCVLVVNLTIHLTLLNNTYLRPFSIQKWG